MFHQLYRKAMDWARHRHAHWYLAAISFTESAFSPLPPDVILIPMVLGSPKKAWCLAFLTTCFSVLGGLLGYAIGYFAMATVEPWLVKLGYLEAYQTARDWFQRWGFWAVFLAGFSPIPYKIFTIAAGAMAMNPLPFVAASLIGRGGRFFLVAGLIALGGERLENALYHHINRIGWITVALVITGLASYKLLQ